MGFISTTASVDQLESIPYYNNLWIDSGRWLSESFTDSVTNISIIGQSLKT
jgi:hypothetical protein